ncbi:MAG: ZIP family metal transporter [Planctomycetes bacterium]|nr:ZIP family metal transporter [Planctomycetota bacterium]MBI3835067.1 ZIP family metal transporter [Planctomycetota bacterium]
MKELTLIGIGLATSVATLLGGLFAIRFKDRLHLILGFSAGAIVGVAFFDLIPESIELGKKFFSVSNVTSTVALGFVVFMILDRSIILHSHHSEHDHDHGHSVPRRGQLGAGSLSLHSFLDGLAIGLAFQISSAVGVIVAIAVLVHDFSDGINTVSLVLKSGGKTSEAFRWLIADAVAPIVGVTATLFFRVPESALSLILAMFAGFFIYIGASDLLPESHHAHPTIWTTVMTVLGVAVLFIAVRLAGA